MLVVSGSSSILDPTVVNAQKHEPVHKSTDVQAEERTELPEEFKKYQQVALSKIKAKELSLEIAKKVEAILSQRTAGNSLAKIEVKEQQLSDRELSNRKRLLEWVKSEEAAYIVGITIHVGSGVSDIRLQWEGLGLDEDLVKALNESGSKNSIPVFQFLKETQSRLARIRDRVYKESGAFKVEDVWVVPESKISIYEELRQFKLMEYLPNELEFIANMYEVGLRDYLERIALIIDSRKHLLDDDKIERLLNYYSNCFPSLAQVQNNLSVSCVPSIRIPAMSERVRQNTELQQAVALEKEALLKLQELQEREDIQNEKLRLERENELREARLARAKLEAEENAYQEWRKNFANSVQGTIDWANSQVLDIVSNALRQMESALNGSNDAPSVRAEIRKKLRCAEEYLVSVANTNSDSLNELVKQVRELSKGTIEELVEPTAKQAEIRSQLDSLRDRVTNELAVKVNQKGGHRQRHFQYMELAS